MPETELKISYSENINFSFDKFFQEKIKQVALTDADRQNIHNNKIPQSNYGKTEK